MKKVLFLAIVLCFLLASCGNTNDASDDTPLESTSIQSTSAQNETSNQSNTTLSEVTSKESDTTLGEVTSEESDTTSIEVTSEENDITSDEASSEEEKDTTVDESNESSTDGATEGQINSALTFIPEVEQLSDTKGIFLLKRYGYDMGWMEANQIANLERGTSTSERGVYFLVVPKFVGSTIEVQSLIWDETNLKLVTDGTVYRKELTPDNFGVIITNGEPEGIPNLQVTVTYGQEQGSYVFSYDGRGDRPAVMMLP